MALMFFTMFAKVTYLYLRKRRGRKSRAKH
jgi:hypothetical protein